MRTTYLLSEINRRDANLFGGKATALRGLQDAGLRVPATLCISTEAYKFFVRQGGLSEKIQLELHRKKFTDMRWEEIWDAALRIRNLFLHHRIPDELIEEISAFLAENFHETPVVVRSSAPEEDMAATSFAGLHESFVNIRGPRAILEHVKLVWSSLWSDRALLYRQELGLDIAGSSMAVVVQELVNGETSGVTFSVNPANSSEGIVEAVYGLNQGLVDGSVEPDRWILDRTAETIKEHIGPKREKAMRAAGDAVMLVDLPGKKAAKAPLTPEEVATIYGTSRKLEIFFAKPQDIEWTKLGSNFTILQARPITAIQDGAAGKGDKRSWYISLQRSEENLKKLRVKIAQVHFPAMIKEAGELAKSDFRPLTDEELAAEIKRRKTIQEKWTAIYWEDFIPFAHGMRLFGKFYNDAMNPADPFEFVELLAEAPLLSINRNQALRGIADYVRQHAGLKKAIEAGRPHEINDTEFIRQMEEFIRQYGDPFCGTYNDRTCDTSRTELFSLIMQLAESPPGKPEKPGPSKSDKAVLESSFLGKFKPAENRARAEGLLELGRASYRFRDDDNILLGRIEEQFFLALQEGRSRLKNRPISGADIINDNEVIRSLADREYTPIVPDGEEARADNRNRSVKPRQLIGQPAGPGIGRGNARVISSTADLALFRKGEVLICDAVDPNMTFVVPLAAGVVERRGGMLIHGAIIAREYGIACVTGVPDADALIQTGDKVTVDGYLGIVTVGGQQNATGK